ncbi:hypothetical protein ACVWZL_003074 [Bradyrhizobium sp. GM2.4]
MMASLLPPAIAQHLCEHAADRFLVGLDLGDGADRARLVLSGGIADHGCAAAHQRDRLVAGLLQPVQHHHGQVVADVQRAGGAIVTDISRRLALGGEGVQPLEIGALVDESTFLQRIEEIRFECSHLSARLTILGLLFWEQFKGHPWELGCCPLLWPVAL